MIEIEQERRAGYTAVMTPASEVFHQHLLHLATAARDSISSGFIETRYALVSVAPAIAFVEQLDRFFFATLFTCSQRYANQVVECFLTPRSVRDLNP